MVAVEQGQLGRLGPDRAVIDRDPGAVRTALRHLDQHRLEQPPERRNEETLGQAQRLLSKALGPIEQALEGREYLVGTFSAADIMLGHAIYMSNRLGRVTDDMPNLKAYVKRIEARPAFQKAIEMQ